MSLVTVGIALSAYAGTRVLDTVRYRQRKTRLRALSPMAQRAVQHHPEHGEPTEHHHYLRISGIALGLALVRPLTPAVGPVGVALTIYSTLPLMRRAEQSVSRGQIGNDSLSSIVCLATLGLGQTLAAALQVTAFHLGYHAVTKSRNLARGAFSNAIEIPKSIRVRRGRNKIAVAPHELQDDDLVLVHTGDLLPVDGRVIQGEISVDQHQLTGEWLPKKRVRDDEVFAGTLVVDGQAGLRATATGSKTAISQLNATLRETADYTSRLQLVGEQWSDRIALPLLLGSAASVPLVGTSSATALLFSAPANAIRATAALTTSSHLTAITQDGIRIKDGRALEALAEIDTFLFDKTGTLTSEDLAVSDVVPLATWSRKQILSRAAAAEADVSHPLARALIATAIAESGSTAKPVARKSSFRVGYGVAATIAGSRVLVGGSRLMSDAGIDVGPDARNVIDAAEARGDSAILIADERRVQGVVEIRPQLRPELSAVIHALRTRGVDRIDVVSGDSEGPTRLIAESLGLDEYFYNILPQDKAALVRRLQAAGRRVCFVGDGINDAPAMKQAHCSISLHGASTAASDTAQVLLLEPSLAKLPRLLDAAQSQQTHLKQVLGYWAAYGVLNSYFNVVLRIGVLPSTLFYAGAFSLSYLHCAYPRLTSGQETAGRQPATAAEHLTPFHQAGNRGSPAVLRCEWLQGSQPSLPDKFGPLRCRWYSV